MGVFSAWKWTRYKSDPPPPHRTALAGSESMPEVQGKGGVEEPWVLPSLAWSGAQGPAAWHSSSTSHSSTCCAQALAAILATRWQALPPRGPLGMLLKKLGTGHHGGQGCWWMWGPRSSSPALHCTEAQLRSWHLVAQQTRVVWWVGLHPTAGQATDLTSCERPVPGCTWRRASDRLGPLAGV